MEHGKRIRKIYLEREEKVRNEGEMRKKNGGEERMTRMREETDQWRFRSATSRGGQRRERESEGDSGR